MAKSAADRARDYRERKRREREAAEAAARDARDAVAGSAMRVAVESALGAMKWLVASDDAAVAQARALARQVDLLEHEGQLDRMLSAHRALSRVLHELGGMPIVRMQHELRSLKLRGGGGDGDEGEAEQPSAEERQRAGNVTSIQRPPKRARA